MIDKKHNNLIVFDLVATLTNAGPRYAAAFERVCIAFGIVPPPQEEILKALGNKNLKQITDEYAGHLSDVDKKAFMDSCNITCDSMLCDVNWHEALFKNVRSALGVLQEQGYVLGIYTGTREEAMAEQLRYHNLTRYFDQRFIRAKNNQRDGDQDSHTLKEKQLRSIIDSYKKDYNGTVTIVGDSVSDYLAASSLGLSFIGFAPEEKARHRLQKSGAQRLFGDFIDLPAAVLRQENKKPAAVYAPKFNP